MLIMKLKGFLIIIQNSCRCYGMRILPLIIMLLFIYANQVNSQNTRLQRKAQKEYLNKVKNLEKTLKRKTIKDKDLNKIIPPLEKLTGIQSYKKESESCYTSAIFIFPNIYNIKDWKDWYDLNKSNLYWDSSTDKICLIQSPKYLIKDPVSEYKKYTNIIDLDYTNYYVVSEDLFDYAYEFIENLTGYTVEYNHEYGFQYPTPEDILFLKNWLQKNKENLYWDKYSQEVKLKH